jgi:DNA ligase D-like protein (predicted 3'-phosphoesterase)
MILTAKDEKISSNFNDEIQEKYYRGNLARPIYVIQEHHASSLHWDLRFEINEVLKSWALPKGAPKGNERRLAVQVPDHPIEYAAFEGTIPEGNYGAGRVKIWDNGTFELESKKPNKIVVIIKGNKLKGRYCLLHFKPKERNWLFFKTKKLLTKSQ